ncbi:aminopeptidase P family protein [Tepidibacter aestuarii]|uniref:aminopeptidase P family protein n=1 Tax=Tepidibacter aestuarii TaxID=2925782 RepID=UPI0020C10630|nr:aminopeptidase P family protein [Tepidibacter aestuarii]CAH2213053.1 Xaa-Pro aminopeptidase [Tepidibacter aestuarii]
MNIVDRVNKLRKLMKEHNIDAYIVPSDDSHQSEYVGDYFKCREFISGFTGSAGTVVVTQDEAGLWTDGRYFIQAANQLEGSKIKLFKMGEEGVPNVEDYLYESMKKESTLGFDGKVVSAKVGDGLKEKLSDKNIKISYEYDLIDKVWDDRPKLSDKKAFLLDMKYAGESSSSKLSRLRENMKQKDVTTHIIATLEDIAWLLNIRGDDVKYNPVVLSYCIVRLDEAFLFVDENKLNDEILKELNDVNINILPYNAVYEFIKNIDENERVLLDKANINYAILNSIPKGIKIINDFNPIMFFKAKKNDIELKNIKNSHIKDGVAFTKFMYWLKNNIGKIDITEMSATEKIEELRRQQDGFIQPSFSTIAGYKEHAAMMHYSATKDTDYKLQKEHLFLIDSGGHYIDGTTDITRTIALGDLSDELKTHFTAVLRGMINLSMAKFLYGVRGYNLDILARTPIWNLGIDYKCGTGHGVGYLLNIHESPNGFRWYIAPHIFDSAVLEEGMLTTNEPGIYIEGSHGIRIENELIVKKAEKNESGQFMEFEVATFAPIDLDAIDVEQLNKSERDYLNKYHELVYNTLSDYLDDDERKWLREYTKSV